MHSQGPVDAALYISSVLSIFRPSYTFTVGICGGPHSVSVGTSCIGYKALYLDTNRKQGDREFANDEVAEVDVEVKSRIVEFANKNNNLKVAVAISSAVLNEIPAERLDEIVKSRQLYDPPLLDMEIYSILKASNLFKVKCLGFLKNITDNGFTAEDAQKIEKKENNNLQLPCKLHQIIPGII